MNEKNIFLSINAEILVDKIKYDPMFIPVRISWSTNFDMDSYYYEVQELLSHDNKKTWINVGHNGNPLYSNIKKINNDKPQHKFSIEKRIIRQRYESVYAKYKITFYIDQEKTIGITVISNEIVMPTLYNHFNESYGFITQKHIDLNIWELKFINLSSSKSDYMYEPKWIKWFVFDETNSHWKELKEFGENKENIKVAADLWRKKYKAHVKWLRKDRPWDSWVTMYTEEIILKPIPWFMPNVFNHRINSFPKIFLSDLINFRTMKSFVKDNIESLTKNPKNIPLNLINQIKSIYFDHTWTRNKLLINNVGCEINVIEKNNDFTKLEIKVVPLDGYIFDNYTIESYIISVKV